MTEVTAENQTNPVISVISFLFPLIGIIIGIVSMNTNKAQSKKCFSWALTGIIIGVLCGIAYGVLAGLIFTSAGY